MLYLLLYCFLFLFKLPLLRRDVKPHKSYTFVDAVENFGHLIFRSDLDSAYNRAGNAFKGQLQQNFIVLHDEKQVSWSQPDHRSARRSRGSSDRGARGRVHLGEEVGVMALALTLSNVKGTISKMTEGTNRSVFDD
jgi:hypothetical protein